MTAPDDDDQMMDASGMAGSSQDAPAGDADMEGDAQNVDGTGNADAEHMSREERRIIGSIIKGVDVSEIYSPRRVTEVCMKFGLIPGDAMDLKT